MLKQQARRNGCDYANLIQTGKLGLWEKWWWENLQFRISVENGSNADGSLNNGCDNENPI